MTKKWQNYKSEFRVTSSYTYQLDHKVDGFISGDKDDKWKFCLSTRRLLKHKLII